MSQKLIPPPEAAPPSVKHLPFDKRFELWLELVAENDALVRSGLKAKTESAIDFENAYREWNQRQIAARQKMLAKFAATLTRAEQRHGR